MRGLGVVGHRRRERKADGRPHSIIHAVVLGRMPPFVQGDIRTHRNPQEDRQRRSSPLFGLHAMCLDRQSVQW